MMSGAVDLSYLISRAERSLTARQKKEEKTGRVACLAMRVFHLPLQNLKGKVT